MNRPKVERRRSPRYLCSQLVEIALGDRTVSGLLEDICVEGAAVSVEAPVEPGEQIGLIAPGMRAEAQVRYCRRRETDFLLGIEFAAPSRWRPLEWQPEHLLAGPLRAARLAQKRR